VAGCRSTAAAVDDRQRADEVVFLWQRQGGRRGSSRLSVVCCGRLRSRYRDQCVQRGDLNLLFVRGGMGQFALVPHMASPPGIGGVILVLRSAGEGEEIAKDGLNEFVGPVGQHARCRPLPEPGTRYLRRTCQGCCWGRPRLGCSPSYRAAAGDGRAYLPRPAVGLVSNGAWAQFAAAPGRVGRRTRGRWRPRAIPGAGARDCHRKLLRRGAGIPEARRPHQLLAGARHAVLSLSAPAGRPGRPACGSRRR
jgi:hypothetical protein